MTTNPTIPLLLLLVLLFLIHAWPLRTPFGLRIRSFKLGSLSDRFLENELVAIQRPSLSSSPMNEQAMRLRLCAVQSNGRVVPLCRKEDDVETDLFADPREYATKYWDDPLDAHVTKVYGEGYYGQRPVPSLGGGPGYGAQADEVWSVTKELLDKVQADGVELPVLDVGIAHGEKARGGSF